ERRQGHRHQGDPLHNGRRSRPERTAGAAALQGAGASELLHAGVDAGTVDGRRSHRARWRRHATGWWRNPTWRRGDPTWWRWHAARWRWHAARWRWHAARRWWH